MAIIARCFIVVLRVATVAGVLALLFGVIEIPIRRAVAIHAGAGRHG
jgi:hypothetical protein